MTARRKGLSPGLPRRLGFGAWRRLALDRIRLRGIERVGEVSAERSELRRDRLVRIDEAPQISGEICGTRIEPVDAVAGIVLLRLFRRRVA